jgi:hypothetical protein
MDLRDNIICGSDTSNFSVCCFNLFGFANKIRFLLSFDFRNTEHYKRDKFLSTQQPKSVLLLTKKKNSKLFWEFIEASQKKHWIISFSFQSYFDIFFVAVVDNKKMLFFYSCQFRKFCKYFDVLYVYVWFVLGFDK